MKALLLIAHGSRRAEANADLEYLAEAIRQRGDYGHVQVSYLELAEPTIAEGGRLCAEAGADEVVMLPYFLSPGVHARDDMAEAQGLLAKEYATVRFRLAEPLGRHPALVELVLQRALEAESN